MPIQGPREAELHDGAKRQARRPLVGGAAPFDPLNKSGRQATRFFEPGTRSRRQNGTRFREQPHRSERKYIG